MPRKRARSEPSSRVVLHGECSSVLSKLSSMRKKGELCDVVVRASGEEFHAHRVILAATSDYMGALFASGMRDSDKAVVVLGDVPPTMFSAYLDFVYDGQCEVDDGALPDVLAAASRLQVLSLQQAALAAGKESLGADTALPMWTAGEALTMPDLVVEATKAAVANFEEIATSDAVLQASYSQLCALLQDDALEVEREEIVFGAIQKWHDHVRPSEADLIALLRHVRFGCMPAAFLSSTVRPWPPMANGPTKELLMDALVSLAGGGTPPTVRKPSRAAIRWKSFHDNMVITADGDVTVFSRTTGNNHDVALGEEALSSGRHEWMVSAIKTPNCFYIGVAAAGFRKRSVPRPGRPIWGLDVAARSLLPSRDPFPACTGVVRSIRVVVDMDARTLSFACDDESNLHLACSSLPDSVHPYVCSGIAGEVCRVTAV